MIDVDRYLELRAVTIQYLRMLEDELIARGGIKPHDRACLTRDERRALRRGCVDRAMPTP